MSKILLNTGPSERGWHPLRAIPTALGTLALAREEAHALIHNWFNEYEARSVTLPDDTRRIPLTQGAWALVDIRDFDRLMKWTWTAAKTRSGGWIAMRRDIKRGVVQLHCEVLHVRPPRIVDHINGDGLDCRGTNLRAATHSQNGANSRLSKANRSGYKGVSYDKAPRRTKRWQAGIKVMYRQRSLGRFATAKEAALAYDKAALRLFGRFAKTNFSRSERG